MKATPPLSRRVSSIDSDIHTPFTVNNDQVQHYIARKDPISFLRSSAFTALISLAVASVICAIDIQVLDHPLAIFQIRLFAWCGLPALIAFGLFLTMIMTRLVLNLIHLMFGGQSILGKKLVSHEIQGNVVCFLLFAELIICRFWLSGVLELIFRGQLDLIWETAWDIRSLSLIYLIELIRIIYILIASWMVMSLAVAFIKLIAINDALAGDILQIRMNRKILQTLCCQNMQQRQRLFAAWVNGAAPAKNNVAEIDAIRNRPMRLPMAPAPNSEPSRVMQWDYSEVEFVEITSLAQMNVLARQVRNNICRNSGMLSFTTWQTLFPSEDMAEQAWVFFFDRQNLADAQEVSEHSLSLGFVQAYTRNALLRGHIRNFDSIFNILHMVFACFWSFAMIYVIATVRGDNPTYMLWSLLAFFGSVTFAVSSFINRAVVSIIFILIKKPYQVGDLIDLDGSDYFVDAIELLTTTLRGIDNKCLIMSNYTLASSDIFNHRLSSPAVVEWMTTLAPDVTQDELEQVRQGLIEYTRAHPEFWKPIVVFELSGLVNDSLKLKFRAWHRLNWQQFSALKEHRTTLIEEFRRLHLSLGIGTGVFDIEPAPAA